MNLKKILFATDFSDASSTALAVAASLARDCRAELLIVHVQQPPTVYGGDEMVGSLYEIDDARAVESRPDAVACARAAVDQVVTVVTRALVEGENL